MRNVFVFVLLLFYVRTGLCLIEEIDLPEFLKNCLVMKTKQQTVMEAPSESVCNTCLTRYLWMEGPNLHQCAQNDNNVTIGEITDFFGKLLCNGANGRRKKRQAAQSPVRKEYRAMTVDERQRFHDAMGKAYRAGYYGWVARFHNEQVKTSAHGGPAFFSYHRFLILILEKVLQHFDPSVAFPYWDSSKDASMDFPDASIIWTEDYFGNCNGFVTTGPYAGWTDLRGNRITRNCGQGGSLFSVDKIREILAKRDIYALSEPSAFPTLESYHDDVHNYVGGTMMPIELAPFDPVFFLHHCFVDYLWEYWRYNHGYNTDYPVYNSLSKHGPNDQMINMPYINFLGRVPFNKDGFSAVVARQAFYQLSPKCDRFNTFCGSTDLQCRLDRSEPVCVSVDRRYRRQTRPLHDARLFDSVNINPSTNTRGKRDTRRIDYSFRVKSKEIDNIYIPRESEPCMGRPIQNTFIADCSCDVKKWAFIPIKVVHLRPNDVHFASSSNVKETNDRYDMYDEHKYKKLNKFVQPGNPATYEDCREDVSGAFKVRIKSVGLSYFGQYVDYVFVDNRLPVSSHVGYIGVEKPTDYKVTKAFITASDACGRLCKATCARRIGNVVHYVPCSGAIKITNQSPEMYGSDFGEAVLSIWEFKENYTPIERDSNIFMVFFCDYSNTWPWKECNKHNE